MDPSDSQEFNCITKKYARPDAIGKITGTTKYCTDLKFHGMLYGAIHQSKYPHAKIIEIDTSEAEKAEGVVRVFTAKDIPGEITTLGYVTNIPTLIQEEVRYMGDVLAFVVADSEKHARAATKQIIVKYQELPVVSDPVEGMKPESPKLGDDGNVCTELHTTKGDIEKGFAEADAIVERVYRTQFIEHEYMETECAIAVFNGHEMVIHGCAQYPYEAQKQVAETLGLDLAHVVVDCTPIGGSYGGKAESMNVVASLAALGAYYLNKPVLVALSRAESMYMSPKRHPFVLHYKAGVKKDGTLTAIKIKNVCDTGPYPGNAPYVLFRSHGSAPGPYHWQNWQVDGFMVLTDNAYSSAMRGFGNPQVIFATESILDELAEKIGIDPMDIRLKNAFTEGSKTMTDQVLDNMPVNLKKVIQRAREISNWDAKRKEFAQDTGRYRRGIGMASSWRGCSFGGEGYDWGSAIITMQKDGTLSVTCAIIETGQGAKAVMAQIAAEALGLTSDKVNYIDLETTITPDILTTSASRGTMIGGSSVKMAAEQLKERLFKHAADLLNTQPENLTAKDNVIWDKTSPDNSITYKELANTVFWRQDRMSEISWYLPPKISWDPKTGKGSIYYTFHWMAQVFEITVDTETGKVTVDHIYAVHDPGRVLNPDMARGQVLGALSWGIGFGLHEEVIVNNGVFENLNLDTYKILRAKDMPPVTLEFLNIPDPNGPYGAKSIGEPGLDLPGAAIANAIAFATKTRPSRLPITPERLMSALKEESK